MKPQAAEAKVQPRPHFFDRMRREPANLQYLEDKIVCFFRMQDFEMQKAFGESIHIPEAELRQLAREALAKNSDKEMAALAAGGFAKEILTSDDIRLILSFMGSVKNSGRIASNMGSDICPLINLKHILKFIKLRRDSALSGTQPFSECRLDHQAYEETVAAVEPIFRRCGGRGYLTGMEVGEAYLAVARLGFMGNFLREFYGIWRRDKRYRMLGFEEFVQVFAHRIGKRAMIDKVSDELIKHGIYLGTSVNGTQGQNKLVLLKLAAFYSPVLSLSRILVERGSDQALFHNCAVTRGAGGYFSGVSGDIVIFSGREAAMEGQALKSTLPHEIEHLVQNHIPSASALQQYQREYGASLASLISLGEKDALALLNYWRETVPRETQMVAEYLGENEIGGPPHNKARAIMLAKIGEMRRGIDARTPVQDMARRLMEKFYLKHFEVSYAELERASVELADYVGI